MDLQAKKLSQISKMSNNEIKSKVSEVVRKETSKSKNSNFVEKLKKEAGIENEEELVEDFYQFC